MSSGIGLVLAGGGGKGAYHIGVWKAFEALGISKYITAISGVSVGALNTLLFANGNFKTAEHVWLTISPEKIIPINKQPAYIQNETLRKLYANFIEKKGIVDNAYAIFSRKGLDELIDQNIDLEKVSQSDIKLFACALNTSTWKTEYFKMNNQPPDMIKDIVFASSALPVAYGTQKINGTDYLDGGLKDNVPVQPLLNLDLAAIIVIHLDKESVTNKLYKNIIEIVPQDEQGGLFSGTLDFSPVGAKRRIKQGYDDAMRIMRPVIQMAKQQVVSQNIIEKIVRDDVTFNSSMKNINLQRESTKANIKKWKEQLL